MKIFPSFDHLIYEKTLLFEDVVEASGGSETPMTGNKAPEDEAERAKINKEAKILTEKLRFHVKRKTPTIGITLASLKTILTYDIPTMAVDDKMNIYINPIFAISLPPQEAMGVLIHEAMHIITLTHFRQQGRDAYFMSDGRPVTWWNICTDYLMNYYIAKDGYKLPANGCIPDGVMGKPGNEGDVHIKLLVPEKVNLGGLQMEVLKPKKVTFNIVGKSAEWLYKEIMKVIPEIPDEGGTSGEGGTRTDGATPVDRDGNEQTPVDTGEPVQGELKPEPGSQKPNTKPADVQDIKKQIQKAVRISKARTGSSLTDVALEQLRPTVDFVQLLKDIFQNEDIRYNWRRSSRRGYSVGSWIPKMDVEERLTGVCIAIDTSGSVSDKMINRIISETVNLLNQFPEVSLDIVKWDTQVYYFKRFERSNTDEVRQAIASSNRRGGTILSSVADYYNSKEELDTPIAVLYFTDGYVEHDPRLLETENYYLIVPGGTDIITSKFPGTTYNIEVG